VKTGLAIIGAGIIGVMTAAMLVEEGYNDIVLIEKKYPGSGGSFRCATGIRASFTSLEHVELMKRSVELWPVLSEKYGFPYARHGYVWLLTREKDVEQFKKIVEFHNQNGVPTRMVSPEEVRDLVPTIKTDNLLAGVYDPLAGKASCFLALLKPLAHIVKKGVKLLKSTTAKKIVFRDGRVVGVETDKGFIEAEKVLVAAGYGSRKILSASGIDLPLENLPKHALITEAFQPVFKPLLIDWETSAYMVQVLHGGFLIGASLKEEPDRPATPRIDYMYKAVRVWTRYFPWLAYTNILRYWTGYYVMTPDHHPYIGTLEEYEGLYIATGFSGHGFMMSPAVGEVMRDYILGRKPSVPYVENLSPMRIYKGRLIKEIAVFG